MKIFANTIVNNEENFIWFALMSVVDYVDKVLIWDTGSTDKTVEIIKEVAKIKGNKIEFKEVGMVDEFQFTKARQDMLDQSDCDWILILDGDEVWWEKSIKKLVTTMKKKGNTLDAIVVPFYNLVGDIYHYQDESAGRYKLLGKTGNLTIKALSRKIPGLHVEKPYGLEGFFDSGGRTVQQRDSERILLLDASFLHLTHIKRSSKRQKYNKIKYELGKSFPKDFKHPEVFFKPYPKIVPSPWVKSTKMDTLRMFIETPLRKIKRKIL